MIRKNNVVQFIFLVFCLILLSGIPVSAAKTWKPFAKITDCRMSKKKGTTGDVLRYSFRITATKRDLERYSDLGDKIEFVRVTWRNEKGKHLNMEHTWDGKKINKSHKESLRVSGKIKIRKGMPGGKWKLAGIWLVAFENLEDENLNAVMSRKGRKGRKSRWDNCYQDLSCFDFKVKTKEKEDTEPPAINVDSLKLVKLKKKNGHYKFSVKVKDKSPIYRVRCFWHSSADEGNMADGQEYDMKYNKKTKCYEAVIETWSHIKNSYTSLSTINVWDIYGNEEEYYNSRFDDLTSYGETIGGIPVDFSKMVAYSSEEMRDYMEANPEKWKEW